MRTLYRADTVHTLSHGIVGEWILVDDRHVERVGTGEPPSADRIVELPGTTILPGFVDAHVHLTGTGLHVAGPPLNEVRSAAGLVEKLAEAARAATGGAGVMGHGFDESTWDRP